MRNRLANIISDPVGSELNNARQLNRSGTRFLITDLVAATTDQQGQTRIPRHLFLQFHRGGQGNRVTLFICSGIRKLPTWWFGTFGSSCRYYRDGTLTKGVIQNASSEAGQETLTKAIAATRPGSQAARIGMWRRLGNFLYSHRMRGGIFWRSGKLVTGSLTGGFSATVLGLGIYVAYKDDKQVETVEVGEESLEILLDMFNYTVEYFAEDGNADIRSIITDEDF